MMRILAIDPGAAQSAYLVWDGETIGARGIVSNSDLARILRAGCPAEWMVEHVVIEQIRGYGIPAGNETFDTCHWSGVFAEAFGLHRVTMLPRKDISLHLCGQARGGDQFVRRALIDRWGGVGPGKNPPRGHPLHGISSHLWAALAVGVTWWDKSPRVV